MTVSALLVVYLATVVIVVPRRLRRAAWVLRAPRVAMALWTGLLTSTIAGVAVAGCIIPQALLGDAYRGDLWDHFGIVLRRPPADTSALAWSVVGVLFTAGTAAGLGCLMVRDLLRAWLQQRRYIQALDVVGRRQGWSWPPIYLIDYPTPASFCMAARGGRIVITTEATRILPEEELAAVLEHERAHLRGRHQLLSACTASLARTLPWVPLFATAGPCVARLVEMAADDAAGKGGRREVVARGLARLVATSPSGVEALSASGCDVAARINRLVDPDWKRQPRAMAAGVGCFTATVAIPALAVAAGMSVLC